MLVASSGVGLCLTERCMTARNLRQNWSLPSQILELHISLDKLEA